MVSANKSTPKIIPTIPTYQVSGVRLVRNSIDKPLFKIGANTRSDDMPLSGSDSLAENQSLVSRSSQSTKSRRKKKLNEADSVSEIESMTDRESIVSQSSKLRRNKKQNEVDSVSEIESMTDRESTVSQSSKSRRKKKQNKSASVSDNESMTDKKSVKSESQIEKVKRIFNCKDHFAGKGFWAEVDARKPLARCPQCPPDAPRLKPIPFNKYQGSGVYECKKCKQSWGSKRASATSTQTCRRCKGEGVFKKLKQNSLAAIDENLVCTPSSEGPPTRPPRYRHRCSKCRTGECRLIKLPYSERESPEEVDRSAGASRALPVNVSPLKVGQSFLPENKKSDEFNSDNDESDEESVMTSETLRRKVENLGLSVPSDYEIVCLPQIKSTVSEPICWDNKIPESFCIVHPSCKGSSGSSVDSAVVEEVSISHVCSKFSTVSISNLSTQDFSDSSSSWEKVNAGSCSTLTPSLCSSQSGQRFMNDGDSDEGFSLIGSEIVALAADSHSVRTAFQGHDADPIELASLKRSSFESSDDHSVTSQFLGIRFSPPNIPVSAIDTLSASTETDSIRLLGIRNQKIE